MKYLLYETTHTHLASQCPTLSSEGKATLKQLFSNENIKKSGINLVAGYMSCPANTSTNHKGFFTTDADIPMAVSKFFGQMVVEVRPVLLLSKIANKLETKHILRFEVSQ